MADGDADNVPSSVHWWFSSDVPGSEGPSGWRLDVVTLLAVIGESSIAEHAQTITASALCLLPRIIPAPQALLKPNRPLRLPEVTAKMTGVYSGIVLDTVGFFANIIHPLDQLTKHSFQVLEIRHADLNNVGGVEVPPPATDSSSFLPRFLQAGRINSDPFSRRSVRLPGPPADGHDETRAKSRTEPTGSSSSADIEAGPPPPAQGIVRRTTIHDKVQDFVANPTLANTKERPRIPAKLWSPIHVLEIFSVLLTFSIIGFAAHYRDGTAILAVSLIAFASSVVGWASWWKPVLTSRSHTNQVPQGDVVIRNRVGGFLLVKCTEDVARELYSGTEECCYHITGQTYRVLMGIGTFLLMVSVILLGNCKWNTQIFIGASYITLNGLYWAAGLLPKHYFWDMGRYEFKDITPVESRNANKVTDANDPREGVESFTRTLWFVIRETQRTAWVERSGAAPSTPQWQLWLREAENAALQGNTKWPAVTRKDEIMKMTEEDIANANNSAVKSRRDHGSPLPNIDEAEQAAPAVEVQPQNIQAPSMAGGF